jgi:hypothetical protein
VIVFQADNSLASKQLEGRKQNKERITLTICCNGDGSNRLPLWVIGKYKNSCCFKNINKNTLGYRNNSTIFYLPPNATSKIQPCDVGIIRSFKAYYCRCFNRLLLQRLEDNVVNPKKIDILCAIQMVVRAWTYEVKPETIFNCFCHYKIRSTEEQVVDASEECPLDLEFVKDLESQIRQFHYHNPMDIKNLLNYPKEQVTAYTPDVDDVIEDQLQERSGLQVEVNDNEADDSQELLVVSAAETYRMVEMLERFWIQQDDSSIPFVAASQKMKDSVSMIRTKQLVQRNIDSFFQRI